MERKSRTLFADDIENIEHIENFEESTIKTIMIGEYIKVARRKLILLKKFFSILHTSPMNNCKIKPENSVIHSSIKKHKIPINLRKMSKTSTIKLLSYYWTKF